MGGWLTAVLSFVNEYDDSEEERNEDYMQNIFAQGRNTTVTTIKKETTVDFYGYEDGAEPQLSEQQRRQAQEFVSKIIAGRPTCNTGGSASTHSG